MSEPIKATMEAVVLTGPGEFHIDEVPTPRPGGGEVLCRVESTTICGTDIHIIQGAHRPRWPPRYPAILGHEWAGRIVALGDGAGGYGFEVGDCVAGTSHSGCGVCRQCLTGRYNLCENYGRADLAHRQYGHITQGSYAEYMVNTLKSIHKVPTEMPFDVASNVDPAACGLHSVKRAGIAPGDTVVVLGPGPIGAFAFECARALGAGRVLVVGSGKRLERLAAQGAETVDYKCEDAVRAVRERTGGRGAQVVVDTAGTPDSLAWAVEMAARGGRVAYTGIPDRPPQLAYKRIVLDELDIVGVRANPNAGPEVVPLIHCGRIRVAPYITHRFPLREYREAFETYVERRDGAILINLTPGA
ncbi:MAG: zinc-binding dehydrogenase [Nitrospinota bacterium]